MNKKYNTTIYACFIGYVVQAIVNNFVPLLFIILQNTYDIPLSKITILVSINFGMQLVIDLLSMGFVDKIGYRASVLIAHICAAAGLILLTILPDIFADPFMGLLVAVIVYAVGGGLLEVLVSPIMETCPTENKEKAMSLLHSFYCWGHVGVVLLSTLFLQLFGNDAWKILGIIWAIVPLSNTILFAKAPMVSFLEEGSQGIKIKELFSDKVFWILVLMMMCAGASEQSVSQWASTFAEKGLGVSKIVGDLAGPMAFAILMGIARAYYGKYGDRINLKRFMLGSVSLCIASYLVISLVPIPMFGLIGCALCGLSVGILWPGTFSTAASSVKKGGTAMFAILALAGDLGCSGGPTLVGLVSAQYNDNLNIGILAAIIFPIILLCGVVFLRLPARLNKTV